MKENTEILRIKLPGLGEVLCVTDTVQILSRVGSETNRAHRSFCTPVHIGKEGLELHLQEILIPHTHSASTDKICATHIPESLSLHSSADAQTLDARTATSSSLTLTWKRSRSFRDSRDSRVVKVNPGQTVLFDN